MSTNEMNAAAPKRCFSCNLGFTDADQVALISTETGWVCELPGNLAKYAVWQAGDAEVFHMGTAWNQQGSDLLMPNYRVD